MLTMSKISRLVLLCISHVCVLLYSWQNASFTRVRSKYKMETGCVRVFPPVATNTKSRPTRASEVPRSPRRGNISRAFGFNGRANSTACVLCRSLDQTNSRAQDVLLHASRVDPYESI